jgi:hypothetical protein
MPAPTAVNPASAPAAAAQSRSPESARDTHRRPSPPRPKKPSDLVDPF